jgi:signal transduction histidine kinase
LSTLLEAADYEMLRCVDASTLLTQLRDGSPDLVLADLTLPGLDGIELCRAVHAFERDLPVIVVTMPQHAEVALACLKAGAEDQLCAPLQLSAAAWCVQRAIERRADKTERERLRGRTDELCAQLRMVNEHLLVSSVREHELAENEARQRAELSALLEGLGEGIVILEASGEVRMINAAARSMLGMESASCLAALRACDAEGAALVADQHPVARALRGADYSDYEVVYLLPNGQSHRVVTTATSIRTAAGAVAVAILVLRDVTRLRRLEQQREELVELVSHDLRTPLSVISMSAQLLEESAAADSPDLHKQCVSRIARNSRRMAVMLQELTDVSHLEAQEPCQQRAPCDVRALVEDVVGRLDEARSRRISIEQLGLRDGRVAGDVAQLDRCITNLITNALKYSAEEAPVRVVLRSGLDQLEISVTDRGIGIAPESMAQIFTRYFRTTPGRGRAEGLGLGLYIARLVAEAHGGRIEVRSELGVGSTFSLHLPLLTAAAQA